MQFSISKFGSVLDRHCWSLLVRQLPCHNSPGVPRWVNQTLDLLISAVLTVCLISDPKASSARMLHIMFMFMLYLMFTKQRLTVHTLYAKI